MSHLELFISQSNIFSGLQTPFPEARYLVLGVPFDMTSTYRTGARFGPTAIRQASINIETHSFRSGMNMEKLPIHDLGDLNVSADPEKTVEMLKLVAEEILAAGKKPVVMGGEHTITYGIMKGLATQPKKTGLVSFDAHLDLREEYMGLKLSHTTFMRLINEKVKPTEIIEVGTRAVCPQELVYAKKAGIDLLTARQIRKEGADRITQQLKKKLEHCEKVYLSVDMDVLDPAYAPAVQNPEPEGIETSTLLDIACGLCDNRVIGFDVLEIAPIYDQGISAVVAAKLMYEIMCQLERSSLSQNR
jgi:agmatinase